jgi:hypothetical protein
MWNPQHLITLCASKACYKESFCCICFSTDSMLLHNQLINVSVLYKNLVVFCIKLNMENCSPIIICKLEVGESKNIYQKVLWEWTGCFISRNNCTWVWMHALARALYCLNCQSEDYFNFYLNLLLQFRPHLICVLSHIQILLYNASYAFFK